MEPLSKFLNRVLCADCFSLLKEIPDNSISSVITDPPYGFSDHSNILEVVEDWVKTGDHKSSKKGFMGKEWDGFVPSPNIWKEVFRVLRPGGNCLVFAGTRSWDIMGLSLRLAGFEIRNVLMWLYGAGFPKSLDISKKIDEMKGAKREVVGKTKSGGFKRLMEHNKEQGFRPDDYYPEGNVFRSDIPVSEEAKEWSGYGTGLKPAFEPIIVVMKPLDGTYVENALKHGVAGINVDACRLKKQLGDRTEYGVDGDEKSHTGDENTSCYGEYNRTSYEPHSKGRWPANVILSHHPDCKVVGYKKVREGSADADGTETVEDWQCHPDCPICILDKQTGGASRFFYHAKVSKFERDVGLGADDPKQLIRNDHTTVKPLGLMRYLCRLVKMPGKTTVLDPFVLDPFGGSGTTAMAAILEGMDFIFIEKDRHYCDIAEKRIDFIRKNKERILMYGLENVVPKPSAQKEEVGKEGIFNL